MTIAFTPARHFKPSQPSAALEGTNILKLHLRNQTELINALQKGFNSNVVQVLSAELGMPVITLIELMAGMSLRTYNRRLESGKPLTLEESETVYRYARIAERAERLLGTRERAKIWLTTPKLALGGVTPLTYARTEPGAEEVLNLIGRIEDGSFA
jgi:putative toxin-antitoxin system antitoxin component (TIGR02293 family)